MKTSKDPRHLKRAKAVQELFAWDFSKDNLQQPNTDLAKDVIENITQIDEEIKKAAPEWPISQINRVDLSILRLAIFELIIVKGIPFKVITDEAVELAKELGSESSPSFINGVLGNIISAHGLDKEENE